MGLKIHKISSPIYNMISNGSVLYSFTTSMNLGEIRELCSHINFTLFGRTLHLTVATDKKQAPEQGRVYLQVLYHDRCHKSGEMQPWKGGKHYLSEHMTEDEIVKKAYVAFEQAVKHEIMEGFKFDDIIVFNPHVNFRELLRVSHLEVQRAPEDEPKKNNGRRVSPEVQSVIAER